MRRDGYSPHELCHAYTSTNPKGVVSEKLRLSNY